ncbi:MAG: Holliday junction branch migration protein RuvA [Acidimicrobiales bacterium]
MIGSVRGSLVERSGDEVIIEVAGIGYRVTVAPSTTVALGELGDEVFVHTHHHFREDDQTLYGFVTREERICFEALISAHGVGPSLGLAILGVHDPAGLQKVLATEDVAALCLVPGVGKKTAQRLLVELKEKLDFPDVDLTATAAARSNGSSGDLSDVREALVGLGYSPDEVHGAMKSLPDEGDTSVLLKHALQQLAERS